MYIDVYELIDVLLEAILNGDRLYWKQIVGWTKY